MLFSNQGEFMKTPILTACVILLLPMGCSTMKVTSESTDGYPFDSITTFQWIDAPSEILDEADTYFHTDIQQALNGRLLAMGLRETAKTSAPDVQMSYYVKLKEETAYSSHADADAPAFTGGLVYSREGRDWRLRENTPDLNVYTLETGTLFLTMFDAKSGKQVWCGSIQTTFDRSRPEEEQREHIRNIVRKLTDRLPGR
jgi:hypothetical protein